jgi:peptidoglycan hydrolase CwlO-like protein
MKIVAWGLFVISLVALGLVWMLGQQQVTQAVNAQRSAEQTVRRTMTERTEAFDYEMANKNGALKSTEKQNQEAEAKLQQIDDRIAELQTQIDEAGGAIDLQARVDQIAKIAQLRRENDQMSQELKSMGRN